MNRIYLDNAATTPLHPAVITRMQEVLTESYGNPSSIHALGRKSRAIIEEARKMVANYISASVGEIFFTSGGTEATNMALKCAVRDRGVDRIITSPIEHHCVLHTVERLEKTDKIEVAYVDLDSYGRPRLEHLRELLSRAPDQKTLVSLMHANNEIGTMTDIKAVGELCREHNALFHSDTVQTFGHFPINVQDIPIDFLTGSAHKFHGPKGVGILFMSSNCLVDSFIDGGGQERNMRAGTENLAGIAGLATALSICLENQEEHHAHIKALRDATMQRISAIDPDIIFHGDPMGSSLATVLNVGFPASEKTEMMLLNLDIEGVCASGGSACTSGADQGSHVIKHVYPNFNGTSIRFSFSGLNTSADVDFLIEKLTKILKPVPLVS